MIIFIYKLELFLCIFLDKDNQLLFYDHFHLQKN